ncbi:MAG: hypothetical protein ACK5U8_17840 [Deltaproteobacteria bacterium]
MNERKPLVGDQMRLPPAMFARHQATGLPFHPNQPVHRRDPDGEQFRSFLPGHPLVNCGDDALPQPE